MQVTSYHTPPAIAKRYGVDPHKVAHWIRVGELSAIDVSTTPGGRPRYRVSPEALAAFEAKRSAGPEPRITRIHRKKDPGIVEFF